MPQHAAPPLDSATAQELDHAIGTVMRHTGVPGAIVGIWNPTGSYVRTFGASDKASGASMEPDMFLRIGSETATFTVTGLLQLVDQGRVGLDDPISRYVPGVPEGDTITLRQLARMQSGLFDYTHDAAFQRALYADPYRPFTPRELLGYSFAHPAAFPPGHGWQYSSTNAVLLGMVVEQASGQSLAHYLRKQVFAPLGLNATSLPADGSFPAPHPDGYTELPDTREVVATDWNPSWAWAAGAMTSDLRDLRTWARALATGRLVRPATQAQRLRTVTPPGLPPGVGYGLGVFEVAGWIGHNGSLPGYQSLTVYLPPQHTTLVVLLNTDVDYQHQEPSSVFGTAITRVITPGHVFSLVPTTPPGPAPTR